MPCPPNAVSVGTINQFSAKMNWIKPIGNTRDWREIVCRKFVEMRDRKDGYVD